MEKINYISQIIFLIKGIIPYRGFYKNLWHVKDRGSWPLLLKVTLAWNLGFTMSLTFHYVIVKLPATKLMHQPIKSRLLFGWSVTCTQSDSNCVENMPTLLANQNEGVRLMSSPTLFVTLSHLPYFLGIDSIWFWVTGSKIKVKSGTLFIKPCMKPGMIQTAVVDDERRNPINVVLREQIWTNLVFCL